MCGGRTAITVAITAFLTAFGAVPCARAERLPIRSYTVADGLPSDTIHAMIRDSRGLLWFATREGLAIFDGYSFETYGRANGLTVDNVSDILQARDGTYWAATPDGLAQFQPNAPEAKKFKVYRPGDGEERHINAIYQDRAGEIWCGTDGGLFRLHASGGSWILEALPRAINDAKPIAYPGVIFIFEDSRGDLWIGTRGALYRRSRARRVSEYIRTPTEGGDFLWTGILEDHKGRLWAATGFGLWRLAPNGAGDLSPTPVYVPRDRLVVWQMLEDPGGKLWLATSAGLMEWDPDAQGVQPVNIYTEKNGLVFKEITTLCRDREGNLWLGSAGGGAMRIARTGIITYDSAETYGRLTRAGTLFRDGAGEVHVAVNHIIRILRGNRFVEITPAIPKMHSPYRGWGWHQTILQDRTGEWWVPTSEGLVRFPPVAIEQLGRTRPIAVYTTRDGLRTNDIFRLFEDRRGGIWIACFGLAGVNGLSRWDRSTERLQHFSEHTSTAATAFAEDRDGNIWIGYYDGAVARFRNGAFTFYGPPHSLTGGRIQAVHVDHAGRVWIASLRGLVRVDEPRAERPMFARFGVAEGLSSGIAYSDEVGHQFRWKWGSVGVSDAGYGYDRRGAPLQSRFL